MQHCSDQLKTLETLPVPGTAEQDSRIRYLREELDTKKRQFENLEYRILEAELAEGEEKEEEKEEEPQLCRKHAIEETKEELKALNVQMGMLIEQAQTQTNLLSSRRHVLLDRLKAEYRVMQRISNAQSVGSATAQLRNEVSNRLMGYYGIYILRISH